MIRFGLLFSFFLAAAACTHSPSLRNGLRDAIAADIASRRACFRLPQGQWAIVREDRVSLSGFALPDGRYTYPDRNGTAEEQVRRAFDLLTELGIYMVVEQPRGERRRTRTYVPTPDAAAQIQWISQGHGVSGWMGLCYGNRTLIELTDIGPLVRAPCRKTRQVGYTYRYVDIPAWAGDPRLREFFPDLIGPGEAALARPGARTLRTHNGRWYVDDHSGLMVIPCVGEDGLPARGR